MVWPALLAMADKSPQRSRAKRLLVPFVVAGVAALVAGWFRLPQAIAALILVGVLWLLFRGGYGPRFRP